MAKEIFTNFKTESHEFSNCRPATRGTTQGFRTEGDVVPPKMSWNRTGSSHTDRMPETDSAGMSVCVGGALREHVNAANTSLQSCCCCCGCCQTSAAVHCTDRRVLYSVRYYLEALVAHTSHRQHHRITVIVLSFCASAAAAAAASPRPPGKMRAANICYDTMHDLHWKTGGQFVPND